MNKTAAIFQYKKAKATELNQVYKDCSIFKKRAFENIRHEMHENGGRDLRITSHTCNFFSCAYVVENKLIYHTYCNRYVFDMDE